MGMSSQAEILPTHTAGLFQAAVRRAAELLRAGEIVALPTETVYGLAANALDAGAVAKIYEIKGRPARNPIIVHVASLAMAQRCAREWPPWAAPLVAAFWPGPLTLVLPRAQDIPEVVTAGGDTVGLRWPSHPFIQAVIRECGFPLAAPSANLSNQISATNAEHVRKALGDKIRLIVDGGQSQVGIESTVLDLSVCPPRVLRPGIIHQESLAGVIGNLANGAQAGVPLKSPGMLRKHYAPKAKMILRSWQDGEDLCQQLRAMEAEVSSVHVISHSHIPLSGGFASVSVIPHDAEAFARAIYAELHRCDEGGARLIVVEEPPATLEWLAIADRLKRAASEE